MKKINICIPMAGLGSRFAKAGYEKPKPLINVLGKPMIEWVITNMTIPDREVNFIFICQEEHVLKYNLQQEFELILPNKNFTIISINKLTEGSLCTVLKARNIINTENELIIVNSDQFMEWSASHFMETVKKDCDGAIITFYSTNPKWSYVSLDSEGWITQVKEKEVISSFATVGFYYFKKGNIFVIAADEIIHKNLRVLNEFYVAPTFNVLINQLGHKIINYPIPNQCFHPVGTPEDLLVFINKVY